MQHIESSEGIVSVETEVEGEVVVDSQTAQAHKRSGIFVLVLVVMKLFFGWNISIIGSVVLTIVLAVVMAMVNRR